MFSIVLSPPVFDELLHPHWYHSCVLDSHPSERKRWLRWGSLASLGCCGGKMRKSWLTAFRRSKLGDERSTDPRASGCCSSEVRISVISSAERRWRNCCVIPRNGTTPSLAKCLQSLWCDSDTDESLIEAQFHWHFISPFYWRHFRQLDDNSKLPYHGKISGAGRTLEFGLFLCTFITRTAGRPRLQMPWRAPKRHHISSLL